MRGTAPSRVSSCVPTLLAHCLMARQGAAAVRRSLVHRHLCCTTEAGLMMCIASVLLLGGVHVVAGGHVRWKKQIADGGVWGVCGRCGGL